MSDQNDDELEQPTRVMSAADVDGELAAMRAKKAPMFGGEGATVPDAEEGDALLDLLFTDAEERSDDGPQVQPLAAPLGTPKPAAARPSAVTPELDSDDDEGATRVVSASALLAAASPKAPPAEPKVPAAPPRRPAAPPPRPAAPPPPPRKPAASAPPIDDDEEGATRIVSSAALQGLAAQDEPLPPLDEPSEPPPALLEEEPGTEPEAAAPHGPMVVRPGARSFSGERDASLYLSELGLRDEWLERAAWLRAEADATPEKPRKARLLLTVAELYASAGEEATAREVALEVRELAPSLALAHAGIRGLLVRDSDFRGAFEASEVEMRAAATGEQRAHAAIVAAEIARLKLGDAEAAQKKLDFAQRAAPNDARVYLQRFAEGLASGGAIAKIKAPDAPGMAKLGAAFAEVTAARAPSPKAAPMATTPSEAVARARAAFEANDVPAAVGHVMSMLGAPELGGGAGWLLNALAAARGDTTIASRALGSVARGSHGELARRFKAVRALESGNVTDARAAALEPSDGAFGAADRVAIGLLSGASREDLESWVDALRPDDELVSLVAAASTFLGGPKVPPSQLTLVGGIPSRAAQSLGRALGFAAAGGEMGEVVAAHRALADSTPESGTGRALGPDIQLEQRQVGAVVEELGAWFGDREGVQSALALAVLSELAGDETRAVSELDRARAAEPTNEPATRFRAAHAEGPEAARLIADLAHATEGERGLPLLVEAAVRLSASEDEDAADRALRRAAEVDPKFPIGSHLGERGARRASDRDRLLEWLRTRREASEDGVEQALDLVREALLLAETDAGAAASLLEQASRARPADQGLRDLVERLATEPLADRAAWRQERAAEAKGREAARLALEAAFEHERAGDLASALACARTAIAAGDDKLAPVLAYRLALVGQGTQDVIDALIPRARETTDAAERLETYERLADLDELGRGDASSGLLWRRTILEDAPSHLPTLRRVASDLVSAGRDDELEPVLHEVAKALSGPERTAHAMVSARLRLRAGTWEDTRDSVELALEEQPPNIWVLRQAAAHARHLGKHAEAAGYDRELIERTDREAEAATLALRAAEAGVKAGDVEGAEEMLSTAASLVSGHLALNLQLAELREKLGKTGAAAEAYGAAAEAALAADEKALDLYKAGVLWETIGEGEKARESFEAVAQIDPNYADVFDRLRATYTATGARAELAALLEARLDRVTDPAERVEMEVLRGRALAGVGDAEAAKAALRSALDANPDHVEALSTFADVCESDEDWEGAEDAWIRLARLVSDVEKQAEIYQKLGGLYEDKIPNLERAELSYQEILKRKPGDEDARERLVGIALKQGNIERALSEAQALLEAAQTPEAKCRRNVGLAAVYEAAGDLKKAEATLVAARKNYPKDDVALEALASYHVRQGQQQAATVLLDRALTDARRALGTGRFEPHLISTVATVFELRENPAAARIARAALAALEGAEAGLDGAGGAVGEPALDDLVAPDLLTPAFRDLLRQSGPLLDTAVPFDLTSVRGAPLGSEHQEVLDMVDALGNAYGLAGVDVVVSSVLGSVCIPASAHPPTIVIGQNLLTAGRQDVLTFLLHRALKVIQANATAFARTAPIDLWPLLAAYLKAFNPGFAPQGVDAGKLTEAYGRISRASPPKSPQLAALAADVAGSIGNRASTLSTAIYGWGSRAGLLATGDLNTALTGIAWAGGHTNQPPASGKDRLTWIGRNAEARELVIFTLSDPYAEARLRLALDE